MSSLYSTADLPFDDDTAPRELTVEQIAVEKVRLTGLLPTSREDLEALRAYPTQAYAQATAQRAIYEEIEGRLHDLDRLLVIEQELTKFRDRQRFLRQNPQADELDPTDEPTTQTLLQGGT